MADILNLCPASGGGSPVFIKVAIPEYASSNMTYTLDDDYDLIVFQGGAYSSGSIAYGFSTTSGTVSAGNTLHEGMAFVGSAIVINAKKGGVVRATGYCSTGWRAYLYKIE